MILHPSFTVEPWCVRATSLDLGVLAQTESVFALSNGHIGWRANFDEGEPSGLPGSYLNGFWEQCPLPYAEAGYGYPESGQRVINVTNGKLIRLLVDDEPWDVKAESSAASVPLPGELVAILRRHRPDRFGDTQVARANTLGLLFTTKNRFSARRLRPWIRC